MKRAPLATRTLSRRAALRGLCGVSVALPALESMFDRHGEAYAQTAATPPLRYLVCFGGQSLGGDGDPLRDLYVPDKVGRDYDLKAALAPLAPVKDEVSVVSGLAIPTANGGAIPAGGRRDDFHVSSLSPLLSGVRSPEGTRAGGPTSDQLVADVIGKDSRFKALAYRVQAAWYLSVSAPYGRDIMSYKANPAGGNPLPVAPVVSPKAAFDSLFGAFAPPADDSAARAAQERATRARKSVLDLVAGNTARLMTKLGAADRQRLAQHLDEVRTLEKQIELIPAPSGGACAKPADPGADPSLGGNQGVDSGGNNTYGTNLGYSGEEQRARVFCDLVHMAFACDLSRVATLMFTMFQSHMNMYPLIGVRCDLHEIGHGGDPMHKGTAGVSEGIAWHMKHFAYLVGKLRDTQEGAGRLIDRAAILFVHEGGHGLDTATGKQSSSHSTENMACLVAGRAGGLKPGQHVVASGKHPANAIVSAMKAVGVPGDALGEVSGALPQLFA